MDERTDVSAAYGLRLAADLLSALVVKGVFTKDQASALIDDSLASMLASHPQHEQQSREIAGALTAGMQLAAMDFERKSRD